MALRLPGDVAIVLWAIVRNLLHPPLGELFCHIGNAMQQDVSQRRHACDSTLLVSKGGVEIKCVGVCQRGKFASEEENCACEDLENLSFAWIRQTALAFNRAWRILSPSLDCCAMPTEHSRVQSERTLSNEPHKLTCDTLTAPTSIRTQHQ